MHLVDVARHVAGIVAETGDNRISSARDEIALAMDDAPAPIPGWNAEVRGGYMNHPPRGAALKKIDPHRNTPPRTKHQKPKADSRGNGRSRAPSIWGMKITAIDSKMGMANKNIITEPCSVKSWL